MVQPQREEHTGPVGSVESAYPRTESNAMIVPRLLLALGAVFILMSIFFTLTSAWDPLFQAPNLPDGPTHTNYYAFRLFTLATGATVIMLYCMFMPTDKRSPQLWTVMLFAGVFYFAGWWLAWPVFGYRAPGLGAEMVHVLATVLSLAAIFLARRFFVRQS
jgi:hypothetical protein